MASWLGEGSKSRSPAVKFPAKFTADGKGDCDRVMATVKMEGEGPGSS